MKTEAKAWRGLAEWCVTHNHWLCWHIGGWCGLHTWAMIVKAPFRAPWADMYRRITTHALMGRWVSDDVVDEGLDHYDVVNSHARVMFCELMALECESE